EIFLIGHTGRVIEDRRRSTAHSGHRVAQRGRPGIRRYVEELHRRSGKLLPIGILLSVRARSDSRHHHEKREDRSYILHWSMHSVCSVGRNHRRAISNSVNQRMMTNFLMMRWPVSVSVMTAK